MGRQETGKKSPPSCSPKSPGVAGTLVFTESSLSAQVRKSREAMLPGRQMALPKSPTPSGPAWARGDALGCVVRRAAFTPRCPAWQRLLPTSSWERGDSPFAPNRAEKGAAAGLPACVHTPSCLRSQGSSLLFNCLP